MARAVLSLAGLIEALECYEKKGVSGAYDFVGSLPICVAWAALVYAFYWSFIVVQITEKILHCMERIERRFVAMDAVEEYDEQ